MQIIKGYKFRIYPNPEQKILIAKTFGCRRFVYNKMLEHSIKLEKEGKKLPGRNGYNRLLTNLKKQYGFLNEPDATALQSADDDIARTFINFNEGRAEHPHFHKKKYEASYSSKAVNGQYPHRGEIYKTP